MWAVVRNSTLSRWQPSGDRLNKDEIAWLLRVAILLGLQPPHHLLHPLLSDVGVNLGGGDALMTEQRLDVHQFGPGVEQVRGVGMAQFVG